MSRRISISVTQEDINHGKRYDFNDCPVAMAVARRIKPRTWTDGASVYWRTNGVLRHVALPPAGREFVRVFDIGQPVAPFKFRMEVPDDLPIPL